MSISPQEFIEIFSSNYLAPELDDNNQEIVFYYKTAGKKTSIVATYLKYNKLDAYVVSWTSVDGKKIMRSYHHCGRDDDRLVLTDRSGDIYIYDIGSMHKFKHVFESVAKSINDKYYNNQFNFKDAHEACEFVMNIQIYFKVNIVVQNKPL